MSTINVPKTLDNLIKICSEITCISLACKNLDIHKNRIFHDYSRNSCSDEIACKDDIPFNNTTKLLNNQRTHGYQESIQNEQQVAKWLESQINDYRAAILRQEMLLSSAKKSEASNNSQTIREGEKKRHKLILLKDEKEVRQMKQILFDETVHKEQERLLKHRIQMSVASKQIAFPTRKRRLDDDKGSESLCKNRILLTRESLRLRDEQVLIAISSKNKVDALKRVAQCRLEDIEKIKEKNLEIWNKYKTISYAQARGPNSTNQNLKSSAVLSSKELSRLKEENEILKTSFLSMIAYSGVDWYSDDRLCKVVSELEKPS